MKFASQMMTPAEVAAAFGVTTKTITKWADDGKLVSIRTPGNHRRFDRAFIQTMLTPPPSDHVD